MQTEKERHPIHLVVLPLYEINDLVRKLPLGIALVHQIRTQVGGVKVAEGAPMMIPHTRMTGGDDLVAPIGSVVGPFALLSVVVAHIVCVRLVKFLHRHAL